MENQQAPQRSFMEVVKATGRAAYFLGYIERAIRQTLETNAPNLIDIQDEFKSTFEELKESDRAKLNRRYNSLLEDLSSCIDPITGTIPEFGCDWVFLDFLDYTNDVRNCLVNEAKEAYGKRPLKEQITEEQDGDSRDKKGR